MTIDLQPTDRVFIAGATESGKSFLARALASRWSRVLVFDPKAEEDMPNAAVCVGVEEALKKLPGRVIYRPTIAEFADAGAAFDRLVAKIWHGGGHHGILAHESAQLSAGSAGRTFEPYYQLAHLQGRQRFVPIIDCSQRPVGVPRVAKSEATFHVAFFLSDQNDRDEMASLMGDQVKPPLPFSHDYWLTGRDKVTRRMAAI